MSIQIPGIATVGPQFNAALEGSIDISNPINFSYGFDLTVCETSFPLLSLRTSHR